MWRSPSFRSRLQASSRSQDEQEDLQEPAVEIVASNQTRRRERHGDEEQVVEEIPAERASGEQVDPHHRIQSAQ